MTICIFLYGLIIGSFLNVCIYRIPRKESIVHPPSGCPACGKRLGWQDMIPVLSYLMLRGKCRYCGVRISSRYIFVELLTAMIFFAAYLKYSLTVSFLTMITLAALMIVAAFIDIDYRIIPNKLITFGLISGFLLGLMRPDGGLKFMAVGLVTGFGILFLVAVLSRGQMGFGDVKFAAVMGLFLGWKVVLVALLMAFLTGALYGIFLIVFKGKTRKTAVPFGPFLAGSAAACFVWGEDIISWYIMMFFN